MNLAHMRRLIPLALALALAGCGVKGALEPPPDSGIEANSTRMRARPSATTPVETAPADNQALWRARRNTIENGTTSRAVVTSPAAESASPLDWLID